MGKFLKSFLSVCMIFCLIFSLMACGQNAQSAEKAPAEDSSSDNGQKNTDTGTKEEVKEPEKEIKLTMWDQLHATPDEQKKEKGEWYISKAIERFRKIHPNVTIEFSVEADAAQVPQKLKAAALAQNGPDIANTWQGMYLTGIKDAVLPLDGKVPQEDLDNLLGWDYVRLGFKKDGAILGYPAGSYALAMLYYNKEIIAKAGLDFEASPPKTATDFDAALEKIKAAGFTPIAMDEGQTKEMLYLIVNYWWGQGAGAENLSKHNSGELKFVDDDGLLNALSYYQSLYTKGFVNKDAASSTDYINKFYQGKAAIVPGGTWGFADVIENMGEKFGIIKPPDVSDKVLIKDAAMGGTGDVFIVANYTQNADMAVEFLHFLSSKEESLEWFKISKSIPIRKDITPDELGWSNDPLMSKVLDWSKNTVYWVDNSIDSEAMNELATIASLVLTGKMTPKQAAEKMDAKMAQKVK